VDIAIRVLRRMNRRRLLKILALPVLATVGGFGYARAKISSNPYYQGPVSDHFDGISFSNPPGGPGPTPFTRFLKWQLGGGEREQWPASYPSPFADKPPPRVDGLRVTLVGHASLLVQTAGLNILIDPIWSERASPFTFIGPKRVNPPGIAFEHLPPVDAVLITHNHYDHLDRASLSRLWHTHHPRFIAPLGNDTIIRDFDSAVQVETGDWGQAFRLSESVTANLEPAYHWSARGVTDQRMALWCAYVLQTPAGVVYHIGDTGYGDGAIFRSVRARYGAPRLALLPIGAYEPRWFMQPQHMNPEEAVRVFNDCGAQQALGHHWGTFQLTDEGIERPLEALSAALTAQGVEPERFHPLRPGEAWDVSGAA
jgi:L-ascorbate metabolism protein UlaG (beta-lactamase superfamily)